MKRLDKGHTRRELLACVRRIGTTEKACAAIGISDRTLSSYVSDHPEFGEQIEFARQQHQQGATTDIQTAWNAHADEFMPGFCGQLFDLIVKGEERIETRVIEKPVKDEQGNIVYDEDGEPLKALDKTITISVEGPPPRWAAEIALKLAENSFNRPAGLQMLPAFLLNFVQFLKREANLPPESLRAVIECAEKFDERTRQQIFVLTGKTPR